MTVWRPPQTIRVKVLGLAWRANRLLLSEVEDDAGRVKGLRALGGGVEFGETREEALRREFQEELGCDASIESPWHGVESLFVHEGAVGHEYVFLASVRLHDPRLYRMESVAFEEADGSAWRAGWFDPTNLPAGVDLYPAGLLPLLQRGEIAALGT